MEITWKKYSRKQKKEVFAFAETYRKFISDCKTERECVKEIVKAAEEAGYVDIEEIIKSKKKIKANDKIYAVNMKKSVALFQIGSEPIVNGMNILGAHIDSPRMDVKQNPLYEDTDLAYLDTHYYGGIICILW